MSTHQDQIEADEIWRVPAPEHRPDGFECLLFHRGRWRHMRWVQEHRFWMFGYGSAGILDTPDRQYAPLPDLAPGVYGDFWAGDPS